VGEVEVGALVGPFRVGRRLGGGGMGVVHEAVDTALGRRVALKLVSPHLADDPGFRARFTREARAQAALESPYVVGVLAHGEDDGRLWLATRLVEGGDLGAMLRHHGPPDAETALRITADVAAGLADAHAAGLVHRDLKPANVLLHRHGDDVTALLTDFGLARSLDHQPSQASLTGTAGTPSYMAPELHTGGRAGAASDLYSLGCLLWAVLTGAPPYAGGSEYEVVRAHREQPVPQLPGRTPRAAAVNDVLRRTLAKDPGAREADAGRVRDDLRRAATLPDEPQRRPTPLLVGAALVAAAAVAATVVVLAGSGAGPGPDPAEPPAATSSEVGGAESARARAVDSLADDLISRGGLTDEEARCTAEEWVRLSGLQPMAEAGLFDDEWVFQDVPVTELPRRFTLDAADATTACLPGV
jgi:serine/threonine protein kinase